MPIAYFSSDDESDAIELSFVKTDASEITLRLLVDSGFTGQSCFVLPSSFTEIAHAVAPNSEVAGALQGMHKRAVVVCRIASIAFETAALAIITDTSALSLPANVHGIAGLQFLRQFQRWGSEKSDDGTWRFFLEIDFV